MSERLRHLWLLGRWLPRLLLVGEDRRLLAEMRAFCRALPERLRAPLPAALEALEPSAPLASRPAPVAEARLRELADLAALLDRRSPLGLCLRRSLVRYRYLSAAGLPLIVHFGAKLGSDEQSGAADRSLTGHAWLTLDGAPYHEADAHWRGFATIYRWPAPTAAGA